MTSSLSIVFPAFNDSYVIARQVETAFRVLPHLALDFEVIVVDDGSTDDTFERLAALKPFHSRLKLIRHCVNQGYGAAVSAGLRAATKDLVFYTDGDGQYDVQEVSRLVEALSPEMGAVNGFKARRSDPWYRICLGEIYRSVIRIFFRLPIRDVDCDFRLIRRRLLGLISLDQRSGAFCLELVKKLERVECRFGEVAVHHYPREYGRSQFFSFSPIFRTLVSLGPLWLDLVVAPKLFKLFVNPHRLFRALGER